MSDAEIRDAEFTEAIQLAQPVPMSALSIPRPPEAVLEEARKAARILKDVIDSKPKRVMIGGKNFLEYEDWLTIARFYGVTAIPRCSKYVEYDGAKGFEATADALLVATNTVISSADAMCLESEPKWAGKPLFQLRSMAQTRASSKALANVFRWVVVLAGYQGTPAEEMTSGDPDRKPMPRPPEPKPAKRVEPKLVKKAEPAPRTAKTTTQSWRSKFWGLARHNGKSDAQIRDYVGNLGYERTTDVPDTLKDQCMEWAREAPLPEMQQ